MTMSRANCWRSVQWLCTYAKFYSTTACLSSCPPARPIFFRNFIKDLRRAPAYVYKGVFPGRMSSRSSFCLLTYGSSFENTDNITVYETCNKRSLFFNQVSSTVSYAAIMVSRPQLSIINVSQLGVSFPSSLRVRLKLVIQRSPHNF